MPLILLHRLVYRRVCEMVGVVAHDLLSGAKDDFKNLALGEARVQEGFYGGIVNVAPATHDSEREVTKSFQAFRRERGFVTQCLCDGIVDAHGFGDTSVARDAVMAGIFNIDGLPNYGDFLVIKTAVHE